MLHPKIDFIYQINLNEHYKHVVNNKTATKTIPNTSFNYPPTHQTKIKKKQQTIAKLDTSN